MNDVVNALWRGLISQLHPKMLALTLLPLLVVIVVWGSLTMYFWHDWVNGVTQIVSQTELYSVLAVGWVAWIAGYMITTILVLLLLPVVLVTILLITSIVAMPYMVKHVAARDYPELEMKQGGTLSGSTWNGLVAVSIYLLLWVITLPLWFLVLPAPLLSIALNAYLNQRLFRYDALADHASAEEMQQVIEQATSKLYGLGAALAPLQFIPGLNLFTPVYVGLAFIHLCLAELAKLRGEKLAVAASVATAHVTAQ